MKHLGSPFVSPSEDVPCTFPLPLCSHHAVKTRPSWDTMVGGGQHGERAQRNGLSHPESRYLTSGGLGRGTGEDEKGGFGRAH